MKSCQAIQKQLPELAAGRDVPAGERIESHLAGCEACAAAYRDLQAVTALLAAAPPPPVSTDGEDRARRALRAAALQAPRSALATHRSRRSLPTLAARFALGAALAASLLLLPWRGSRDVGAAVEAAVQRANTWHLRGWKLVGGQQVPWEVWGRRTPFFYREQLGEALNFDDGSQRVRMVTTRPDGKPFALRLASGPAPSDQWQRWMTMGRDWHNLKPWRETPDTVVIHSGGVSDRKRPYPPMGDYFIIDKRTWLPLEWEYRADTSTSPRVEATLRAEYDVSLPDDTTRLKLPEGARLVDTLSPAASANVPTENVQRARGLTLQVVPLAMDTDGTVLVRSSCWLGTLKLGVWDGTPVSYSVETDHMRFGADGTQDTPYHADDGSRYIDLRTSLSSVALPNGDQLKLLAPLAPRPKGAPLPRSLKLELLVWVSIRDEAHQVSWGGDSFLLRQPFTWTLPLPTHPSPLRLSQYAPGPGPRGLPLAAAIASDRALQYDIMGDRGRAVFWTRQALGAVKPESNEAQDFRLALAGRYDRSGNRQRAEAVYREIIAVRQQHPETRNYYAWQAQVALRTPTAVRRRR